MRILDGDSREVLRMLPDNSIDSCVTDPPYALVSIVKRFGSPTAAPAKGNDAYMRASAGFMGKTWDTGETTMSVAFWTEVLRVLKPGAFVMAFGATRGYHRMACAIEDAGFEIRDSLMWVYGTGFPKSRNIAKDIDRALGAEREMVAPRSVISYQRNIGNVRPYMLDPDHQTVSDTPATAAAEWDGWGTALKPAFEPIVLARKPLSEGTVAANVLRWRTGAINVDGCRIETDEDQRRPSSGGENGLSGTATFKIRARTIDEQKIQGRWPANVVHDGSDEVVGMFPNTKSGQLLPTHNAKESENGSMSGKNYAGRIKSEFGGDSGSAARFFYSAKASKADRNGSKHPTIKPIALMQWLCRLVTPPGGVVLDPFAGSGTTGEAANREGFDCILIEREAEYVADIKRRFGAKTPWEVTAAPFPWATP